MQAARFSIFFCGCKQFKSFHITLIECKIHEKCHGHKSNVNSRQFPGKPCNLSDREGNLFFYISGDSGGKTPFSLSQSCSFTLPVKWIV